MRFEEEIKKLKNMTLKEFKGEKRMGKDLESVDVVCGNCGEEACDCPEEKYYLISKFKYEEKFEENKNMGQEANVGMARDDSSTSTRLLDKHFSPLIVRKYQMEGWPLFIGIISDANLNDLDEMVYTITDEAKKLGFLDGKIQDIRNYCGYLNDRIVKWLNGMKRGCAEGIMVCFYCDKMWTSAAFGDLMVHEKCVAEFYHIVNTLPHI